ncbi:MAG: 3-keto-disaccharide hydrolase [Pirellulales bacterium]
MQLFKHLVLWIVLVALAPRPAVAAEEGFTPLFDGKTLNGWTIDCMPKDRELGAKAWTVDRGTLLANTIGHKEHFYILLATDKEYGDFVLRLRVQIERNISGNSGIQIRSRYVPETGWMEGPQIDIDPPNPRGTTGKLWNEGPGEHRWLANPPVTDEKFRYAAEGDGWNDMEITAQGMKITSVLNGVTVAEYDGAGVLDDALHREHRVGTRGVIGLQIHSFHELKLRFKDIRIKELPGGERLFARGDLAGWVEEQHNFYKEKNPNVRTWSVKDGVVACDGSTGNCGFLRYEKKLSDFTLRLEYRLAKDCNSGVCIRTPVPYDGRPEATIPSGHGYEVQIMDDAGAPASATSTGAFYSLVAPRVNAAKPAGQWNAMEIVCRGPKIRVTLNGKVVQDVDQTKIDAIRTRPRVGYISLQNHGGNIEFRNVRLEEEKP